MIPRVVLDTNIYVSALRYGGKPKQVLDLALNGSLRLLISAPLKLELERVLRDKFDITARKIAESAELLWSDAEWIVPAYHLNLCLDESDNRVLECALEGKAGYIVTGDRHLLNLQPLEGLAILSPDAFLARFNAAGAES
jgi:putative PIN family toxin of toxin-antitoxin system